MCVRACVCERNDTKNKYVWGGGEQKQQQKDRQHKIMLEIKCKNSTCALYSSLQNK